MTMLMSSESNEQTCVVIKGPERTGSEEPRDVPFEENLKPVDEDEDGVPEATPISQERLEPVIINIFPKIKSLRFHSPSCYETKVSK